MSRYRLALVLTLITLGSVGFSLWNGRIALFRITQSASDGFVVEARRGQPLAQSFTAYYPGVAEIAVQLAELNLPAPELVTMTLIPQTASSSAMSIMQAQIRLQAIRNDSWLHFKFEPLDQTRGQHYVFLLESSDDASLRLLAHRANMYPDGELQGTSGDLVFHVGYNGKAWPTLFAFLERVSQRKPGLLGQPWFYMMLFTAYTGILVITALLLTKQFLSRSDPEYED
jgi:hypothetical protein